MTIFVAWVISVSGPPPGGQRPSATAFFRVATRASRLGYGPVVENPVSRAELHVTGKGDRRQRDAAGQLGFPALEEAGQRPRLHLVLAELVVGAELARLGQGREGEGRHDLRAHARDELLDLGRPVGVLGRRGADARALLEALVAPDAA